MGDERESGQAADTGSMVHAGASEFHRTQSESEGLAALEASIVSFPAGNLSTAIKHYKGYVNDPKNKDAKVVRNEEKIQIRLPPAPFDPTGKDVVINGTLDQVREMENGTYTVDDIKTTKEKYGPGAVKWYAVQQAAYVVGAKKTWGYEKIKPGNLILTYGYLIKRQVHYPQEWTYDDCLQLLASIPVAVAYARMGTVFTVPGSSCDYCAHKKPANCLEYIREHVR